MSRLWIDPRSCALALVWVIAGGGAACFTDSGQITAGGSGATTVTGEASSTTADETDTTSEAPTTTTGDGTSDAGTTETGTTGERTTGEATTISDSETTADPTTTTTTGEETGVEPGTHVIAPTIATCVLLANGEAAHGSPETCMLNAAQQYAEGGGEPLSALVMIDLSVVNYGGLGRRAEGYLHFEIPEGFGGATIVSATLKIRATTTVFQKPQSGELWAVEPFTADSLEESVPELILLLAEDPGEHESGEWLSRVVPPELVVAGEPLYLGLLPTHTQAVLFYGGGAMSDDPPYLELVVE